MWRETSFTTIRENHCRFEMILNSLQPFFSHPSALTVNPETLLQYWSRQRCMSLLKDRLSSASVGKIGLCRTTVAPCNFCSTSTLTSWDRPHRVKSLIVSHEGFKGPRVCKNRVVYHWHPRLTCRWIPYNEKSLSFYLFFLLQSEIDCWISPFVMSLRAPLALTKLQFQQEGKIKGFCGWWKRKKTKEFAKLI